MAEIINISKDNFLFKQGDIADSMYIVKSGEIGLYFTDHSVEKIVSKAQPGQLFGEMSLFDRQTRSASARAHFDSEVVILPYQKLQDELKNMPEWVQATLKTLTMKIRHANTKYLNDFKKKQG